jgi:hypothetical protein
MVRRVARRHGFLDPILLLSRLGNFAQPSEVGEPIELLRAGVVFHARGLMNTRAIQNNLDWIWPYWVERQFNPRDSSFIPRGFSFSHINVTHRNWTAVGIPDSPYLPIVDPSGLVTPYFDGWSLDAWIVTPGGVHLLPSKSKSAAQTLDLSGPGVAVETEVAQDGIALRSRVEGIAKGEAGECLIRLRARAEEGGWLAISLRPCNPEGVSFVNDVRLSRDRKHWIINDFPAVGFSEPVDRHYSSEYRDGDVFRKVLDSNPAQDLGSKCKVGLATAAALFPLDPGEEGEILVRVDLAGDKETPRQFPVRHPMQAWERATDGLARLEIPEPHFAFLYRAALRSLALHSPGEVFPGPYTYKRFWFRDAAFILNAMLAAGMTERVERTLDIFPSRQTLSGYYLSQEGEWDSNGEALWILRRFCETMGRRPKAEWLPTIERAADWIGRKRIRQSKDPRLKGLLPAGFSAEHLGPNDYYYWDDFWGVAGLQSAAWLLDGSGNGTASRASKEEAKDFLAAIESSLAAAHERKDVGGAVPASPLRRMDSGSIGSIAASYPLCIWSGDDPRIKATLEFLLRKCMFKGCFFQDMIHSGMNAYLTLHMAQCLLRAGDPRFFHLIRHTAAIASPTGQWPEAIHPHTLGGCMGDGQHIWAAAEWVLMMRNLFVREEDRVLVLASGIPEEWASSGKAMSFGPAPTHFGAITVSLAPEPEGMRVSWDGKWHTKPACIVIRMPGRKTITLTDVGNGTGSALVPHPTEKYQPTGLILT